MSLSAQEDDDDDDDDAGLSFSAFSFTIFVALSVGIMIENYRVRSQVRAIPPSCHPFTVSLNFDDTSRIYG